MKEQPDKIIQAILVNADERSPRCGKLLQWGRGPIHFGVGLNDGEVFDTTGSMGVCKGADGELVYTPFTPKQVIARLCLSVLAFHDWEYSLFCWNCEHWARLVAQDDAISYQVRITPAGWFAPGGIFGPGGPFNGGSWANTGRHLGARDCLRGFIALHAPWADSPDPTCVGQLTEIAGIAKTK